MSEIFPWRRHARIITRPKLALNGRGFSCGWVNNVCTNTSSEQVLSITVMETWLFTHLSTSVFSSVFYPRGLGRLLPISQPKWACVDGLSRPRTCEPCLPVNFHGNIPLQRRQSLHPRSLPCKRRALDFNLPAHRRPYHLGNYYCCCKCLNHSPCNPRIMLCDKQKAVECGC